MKKEKIIIETQTIIQMRVKPTERDCPRCNAVLVQNEKEGCYECLDCGYIDCGDDD